MKKELVKELNEIRNSLSINPNLFRCIVVEAIVYTKKNGFPGSDEEVFNLSKQALEKVDNNYLTRFSNSSFPFRSYAKELIEMSLEEKSNQCKKNG